MSPEFKGNKGGRTKDPVEGSGGAVHPSLAAAFAHLRAMQNLGKGGISPDELSSSIEEIYIISDGLSKGPDAPSGSGSGS